MLHEAAYRAALPGGVASLEQDDYAVARLAHRALEFDQLHLQGQLLGFVLAAAHLLRVGVEVLPEVADAILGAYAYRVFDGRGVGHRRTVRVGGVG